MNYEEAKTYALRCLSRRGYLSTDLVKKLKEKQVPLPIALQVIEELKEHNFINDEEWIQSFIRVQQARHAGPRLIAAKLAAKGVRGVRIEEEKGAIQYLLKTKYGKRNLSDFKERQKVIGALMRKGFDFEEIQAAMSLL